MRERRAERGHVLDRGLLLGVHEPGGRLHCAAKYYYYDGDSTQREPRRVHRRLGRLPARRPTSRTRGRQHATRATAPSSCATAGATSSATAATSGSPTTTARSRSRRVHRVHGRRGPVDQLPPQLPVRHARLDVVLDGFEGRPESPGAPTGSARTRRRAHRRRRLLRPRRRHRATRSRPGGSLEHAEASRLRAPSALPGYVTVASHDAARGDARSPRSSWRSASSRPARPRPTCIRWRSRLRQSRWMAAAVGQARAELHAHATATRWRDLTTPAQRRRAPTCASRPSRAEVGARDSRDGARLTVRTRDDARPTARSACGPCSSISTAP